MPSPPLTDNRPVSKACLRTFIGQPGSSVGAALGAGFEGSAAADSRRRSLLTQASSLIGITLGRYPLDSNDDLSACWNLIMNNGRARYQLCQLPGSKSVSWAGLLHAEEAPRISRYADTHTPPQSGTLRIFNVFFRMALEWPRRPPSRSRSTSG